MTKEEFYKFAENRPECDDKCYYHLTLYLKPEKETYKRTEEGEWKMTIHSVDAGIFTDKQSAENAISKETEVLPRFGKLHFAVIERIPFNKGIIQHYDAWWLYNSKGEEIDHSVCSLHQEPNKRTMGGKYLGRRPEELRFKKGDIAEVFHHIRTVDSDKGKVTRGCKVTLGVIYHTPGTIEEEWEYFNSNQEKMGEYSMQGIYPNLGYFHDTSDDQYGYFTGCVPDNSVTRNILPVSLPIDDEIKHDLTEAYERFELAQRCAKEYNVSGEEYFMLLRGEITEEDVCTTRKMSEYIKQHPGKEIDPKSNEYL